MMPNLVIWKFPLEVEDVQRVMLPKGARPLSVQMQGDKPCLWALCDPDASKEQRFIAIHGTGHPINHKGTYISTFQMRDGALVFHAFDLGP